MEIQQSSARWSAAVCFTVSVFASLGFAQTLTDEWRARNDQGDRYEGVGVKVDVANPRIELRSFLVAPPAAFQKPATLQLFFYPHIERPVHVWAQERRERQSYRMEPKIPAGGWKANVWNSYCTWRSNVLDQHGLSPADVGVIARLDDDHPRSGLVAPVLLTAAGQPLPAAMSDYEATFRLGMASSRISYAVMAGCKGLTRLSGDFVGIKNSGDVFSIRFSLPSDHKGEASLVLTAAPLDKTPEDERRYCFMPPPAAPPTACPM